MDERESYFAHNRAWDRPSLLRGKGSISVLFAGARWYGTTIPFVRVAVRDGLIVAANLVGEAPNLDDAWEAAGE